MRIFAASIFLLMAGMAMATESVARHRIDHAIIQTNDPVHRDRAITALDMPACTTSQRNFLKPVRTDVGCVSDGSRNLIPEPRHRRPI